MKIHMDYLEGKIEQFQAQMTQWEKEKMKLDRQLETSLDKYKLIKDQKDREVKDMTRKLTDIQNKFKAEK
jgi:predicted RNase H-like nuclease (RuvC/YqgF family)